MCDAIQRRLAPTLQPTSSTLVGLNRTITSLQNAALLSPALRFRSTYSSPNRPSHNRSSLSASDGGTSFLSVIQSPRAVRPSQAHRETPVPKVPFRLPGGLLRAMIDAGRAP